MHNLDTYLQKKEGKRSQKLQIKLNQITDQGFKNTRYIDLGLEKVCTKCVMVIGVDHYITHI